MISTLINRNTSIAVTGSLSLTCTQMPADDQRLIRWAEGYGVTTVSVDRDDNQLSLTYLSDTNLMRTLSPPHRELGYGGKIHAKEKLTRKIELFGGAR